MPLKFTYICDLLERLEGLEVRDVLLMPADKKQRYFATIDSWFKNHRKLLDAPDTDRVALLSTLFPERRTDRVYFLKEQGLVKILGRCLGLGRERLQVLENWKSSDSVDLATLICNMQRVTDAALSSQSVTVETVDHALAKLAARCRFSSPEVRSATGKHGDVKDPEALLRPILIGLSSRDLKWFIRLILKRFNPVTLDESAVLRNVHPLLPRVLKFQSTFQAAIKILEEPSAITSVGNLHEILDAITSRYLRPQIGVKIGRPEFVKARSIKHCLTIASQGRWALEPKYDGEYCQLHIDLSKGAKCIQIFSKSGKDSTQDRHLMHDWIKACLKIGQPDCRFREKCILEGEMVVYSDKDNTILDFHKIRKHVSRSGSYIGTEADSPRHPHEHLMIVFYDALLIDDDVVMAHPYEYRRRRLRELMHYYPGWCQTSDWGTVDFGKLSIGKATNRIDKAFAKAIALRCEGLMLKPCDQPYFSLDERVGAGKFIKLKKDYIPGLGDTADFAIVGASYDASEVLAEAPNAKWTHFTIACLENKLQVCRYQERPIFRVLGSLSRPCIPLPDLLFLSDLGQFISEPCHAASIPTDYDVLRHRFDRSMDVTFKKPFIVEVLGSSFEKPPSRSYFMLRHPRILKVYRDRGFEDIVSFEELQDMAHKARTLPEDAVREEAEWLERIQKTHRLRDVYSASTASPTTTTSPGSKRSSPSKSPYRPIPFVRVDTSELLPGETNVSPPTVVRSKNAIRDTSTGLLPTPPPSSLLAPTASATARAPAMTQPAPVSLKRKRANAEVESSQPEQLKSTKLMLSTSKHPLIEITNSPPKRDLESRIGANEAVKVRKVVHFSKETQENSTGNVEEYANGAAIERAPHASMQTSVTTRHEPIGLTAKGRNLIVEVARNASRPTPELRMAEDSQIVPPDRHEAPRRPNTGVHCNLPTTQVSLLPSDDILPPTHAIPFSKCTLYLSPCVATVPYLTEDLVPKLLNNFTATPSFTSTLHKAQVTTSLAHWVRAVQDLPPLSAIVPESQAFAGMQKAVLVESRRRTQTEIVIQRIVREINLLQEEVVDVWDWRALEEVVDTMAHLSLCHGAYPPLRDSEGLISASGTTIMMHKSLHTAISAAVEQARTEDTVEAVVTVLQKWYLGYICRSDKMHGNVWTAATDAEKKARAAVMAMTGGACG